MRTVVTGANQFYVRRRRRKRRMSQWASMTVLPAEDFARLQADRDATVSGDRESYDLHSLWYNFHELFRDEKGRDDFSAAFESIARAYAAAAAQGAGLTVLVC